MVNVLNSLTGSIDPLAPPIDGEITDLQCQIALNTTQQIVNSYHQTYDHLQEAVQNAVDACEDAYFHYQKTNYGMGSDGEIYVPRVSVTVDLCRDEITIVDNGMGMPYDSVKEFFLRPYATLKRGNGLSGKRLRGEKGVGATFLAYGSRSFKVTTRSVVSGEFTCGKLDNGIQWLIGNDVNAAWPILVPCREPHPEIAAGNHGTAITIGFSTHTKNMRDLSRHGSAPKHWEAILRLFTALGYVDMDRQDPFLNKLTATVKVAGADGESSMPVGGGYLFPDLIPEVSGVRLNDLQRDNKKRLSHTQRNKDCIWEIFSADNLRERLDQQLDRYTRFERDTLWSAIQRYKPECYAMFAWSSEFWQTINRNVFQTRREEFESGIIFVTRGQRVARTEELQFSTRAGDHNRFLAVVALQDVTLDIGRKSLPQEVSMLGQLIGDALHGEFLDNDDALRPAPRRGTEESDLKLEDLENVAIEQGTDIVDSEDLGLHLLKEPREEQDVVALFFDLLGSGRLKGFSFFTTHISEKYDAIAAFQLQKRPDVLYDSATSRLGVPEDKFDAKGTKRSPKRSFLEFKFNSDDLIRDFVRQDKRPNDIRWLVCWEIGNRHAREGYAIIPITGEDQRNHREYYGVTHLVTGTECQVHVICLKDVLAELRQNA